MPVAGYIVSKADRVLELLVDPVRGPLLLQPIIAHRVLACMTGFFLAMVGTYVWRKYLSFGPDSEQPPKSG